MGRSPNFSYDGIEFPSPSKVSEKLKQLKVGQKIRLDISPYRSKTISRTVSTYGYNTSSTYSDLIVDYIDGDFNLHPYDVKSILLREPSINNDSHYYDWVLTTDGFIRECEHYGILSKVDSIEIL